MSPSILTLLYVLIISLCPVLCSCDNPSCRNNDMVSVQPAITNPFFAMDPILRSAKDLTWSERVDLVARLGYAGLSTSNMDDFDEILDALDRNHIQLFGFYFDLWIDPDKESWDSRINDLMDKLKGRNTVLWINVRSNQFKSSDPAGDGTAIPVIRNLADLAAESDLRVVLYPHTWMWVETTDDALRVAQQVGRPNVGVTFNLCHWLRVEKQTDPTSLLEKAMSHLMMVSINGANYQAEDWPDLIQNLGQGDFDTLHLLNTLRRLGYHGPIGLQNYGIEGDIKNNLKQSINAWRHIQSQIQ